MSDGRHEDSRHRRPHPPPMAAPFLEFDLARELEQLRCEPWPTSGQNAKTLVKYDDFRVVLIALTAHAMRGDRETAHFQDICPGGFRVALRSITYFEGR